MNIPEKLADWSFDRVIALASTGQSESDRFDFKEHVIHKGDEAKLRFRRSVCSFANSSGGYLVFGVRHGDGGAERVVGLPRSSEHLTQVTDLVVDIEPSVHFSGLELTMASDAERVVLIVHVPRGRAGPHCARNDRTYHRRAFGRTVEMTREELRMAFIDHEERVGRIRLVYLSLIDNWIRLEDSVKKECGDGPIPLVGLDLSQIRAHLGEVQLMQPDLLGPLLRVLRELDALDSRLRLLMSRLHHPYEEKRKFAEHDKGEVHIAMERIRDPVGKILAALQGAFGFASVRPRPNSEQTLPPLPEYWNRT